MTRRAPAIRLAVLVVLALAAAYQRGPDQALPAVGPLSTFTYRGFSPPESGFRWSGARSTIVFLEPGPGVPVRVELDVSAWRPRGQDPPAVTVSAAGRETTVRPGRGQEIVVLEAVTAGAWRSDLAIDVASDTFRPGGGDPRELGIRVHGARVTATAGGLRRPSARAVAFAVLSILILFDLLVRFGSPLRTAEIVAAAAAIVIAAGYVVLRPWTALLASPLLALLVVTALVSALAPAPARAVLRAAADVVTAAARGARALADGRVAALMAAGVVAVVWSYRATPRIEIDLGSGREVAVARGFGVYDAVDGVKHRRAPRGAVLDLRDFGGGTRWRVEVTGSLDGAARTMPLLRADGREAAAELHPGRWATTALEAEVPAGWRAGPLLEVPQGSDALRLDRVVVDRGATWPSLRVLAMVLVAALLVVVAFAANGVAPSAGLAGAALLLAGAALALARDPLVAIPFVPVFLAIVAMATLLAAVLAAAAGRVVQRGHDAPPPGAILASACGFAAWLSATAFPLYRGGHFVFHSSIAEEIWKGRFLIYYLPYPGSMLSEQAHWGNIVVPHPALYQTLVAPLAALPRPWFFFVEKTLLALVFASLVLVSSRLAARLAGPGAATWAAVAMVGLVPTFQLLGLGHLMTILGVWASSLALAWLALRGDRLSRRGTWWAAVGLLTFCFLSYTAALLFTAMVVAALWATLLREDRPRARALLTAGLAAAALAFVAYYVHWTWPFLSQSVPKIMGGSASEPTPLLRRLAAEPGKLAYSYGSMLVPLAGLAGLLTVRRSWERRVVLTWGAILLVIGAADLFFNFILKHHYYVIVPVAVGLGALLERASASSRAGRLAAGAALLAVLALGLRTALDVATGRIP